MFESKTETTPLAPLPAYLIDLIKVIFLIIGCVFGIVGILRLIFSCYRDLNKIKSKAGEDGDEETRFENAPYRAILPVDGNSEEYEELKRIEEENDKRGNQ